MKIPNNRDTQTNLCQQLKIFNNSSPEISCEALNKTDIIPYHSPPTIENLGNSCYENLKTSYETLNKKSANNLHMLASPAPQCQRLAIVPLADDFQGEMEDSAQGD